MSDDHNPLAGGLQGLMQQATQMQQQVKQALKWYMRRQQPSGWFDTRRDVGSQAPWVLVFAESYRQTKSPLVRNCATKALEALVSASGTPAAISASKVSWPRASRDCPGLQLRGRGRAGQRTDSGQHRTRAAAPRAAIIPSWFSRASSRESVSAASAPGLSRVALTSPSVTDGASITARSRS